ncbi:hypothetical protein [Lutimaribacter saemankumensis]|nr:hypothetical protein [Lutimaribacter saemankumensis]
MENETYFDELFEYENELQQLGDYLGLSSTFWNDVEDIEVQCDLLLSADYFLDVETDELILVTAEISPSQINDRVLSGAKWASKWSIPFSKEWYVCQAFEALRQCYAAKGNQRARASFQLGKAIAEATWKARTEGAMQAAVDETRRKARAGAGGGKKSNQRRLENLETLMQEIERLSGVVDLMSEDRIVEQAFEAAQARQPKMPKTKRTLDGYGTALRSEEPFKSRYNKIFRRNT